MGNVVEWEDWDDEAVDEQLDRIDNEREGGDWRKMEVGDNYLRILPPLKGQRSPFVEVWQHFLGGNDWPGKIPGFDDKPLVFACPDKMDGLPCAVCEKRAELEQSRSKSDRELARMLKPSMRVFVNVVDMENPDAGVQIQPISATVFEQLMEIRKNPRKGGNFTHPEHGRVIIITRTGTGKNDTRYSCVADTNAEELEDWSWIEQQHDLLAGAPQLPSDEDEATAVLAIEQVEAAAGGQNRGGALPRQRGKRRGAIEGPARGRGRRRQRREPEDDDPDVVDAEEVEPPKKRRKRSKAKKSSRSFKPRSRAQDAIGEDEDY